MPAGNTPAAPRSVPDRCRALGARGSVAAAVGALGMEHAEQALAQRRTVLLALQRERDVGLEPREHVAGVVALVGLDHDGVDLLLGQQRDQRVGELDLAALARGRLGQDLHDRRREQVAAEDREVGRRLADAAASRRVR